MEKVTKKEKDARPKKFREIYYKCPNCNGPSTLSEQLEECSNGGVGMCYCEYNKRRILHKYKRIGKKEWLKLKQTFKSKW